jgi:hypothetical protein
MIIPPERRIWHSGEVRRQADAENKKPGALRPRVDNDALGLPVGPFGQTAHGVGKPLVPVSGVAGPRQDCPDRGGMLLVVHDFSLLRGAERLS